MMEAYRNRMQIRSFRGQYAALSNFGGAPFAMHDYTHGHVEISNDSTQNLPHMGMRPVSAEHHFQALKTLNMRERWWVYGATSGQMAKSRGRMVTMMPGWTDHEAEVDYSILAMSKIFAAKFAVPANRNVLMATQGFDLIEGNTWHDQLWGDCSCSKHAHIPGKNRLGVLLMRERDLITNGQH